VTWTRRALDRLGANPKVRFARLRAVFWALLGLASVPLGWANSVALVWAASVYANVESGIASGEAADDRKVLDRLDDHEVLLRRVLDELAALRAGHERVPEDDEQRAADETEDDDRGQGVGADLA
jgi:hypothetical protein